MNPIVLAYIGIGIMVALSGTGSAYGPFIVSQRHNRRNEETYELLWQSMNPLSGYSRKRGLYRHHLASSSFRVI